MTGFAATLVLAAVIGISLGLLGGGGSILAVPLLVYVAGLPVKEAIATSLLVVGVTSAVAVWPHARAGRIQWRTALIFGAAGMAGAYAGGRLAAFVPAGLLLTAFGLMMLATAVAMIRGGRGVGAPAPRGALPVPRVVLDGLVVGLVTGLLGAGGGFLVVPALVLLGGLPMSVAVGTSLVVIAMKSSAGLAGYLAGVDIGWGLAAAVTAAAVVGSLAGARLTGRIPEAVLRRSFGWFVIAMGGFVLAGQLPRELLTAPAFPVVVLAGCAIGAVLAAIIIRTRRSRRRAEGSGSVRSSEWDDRYASMSSLMWSAEPNRFVVEEVADLRPGRALDLAAGEGRNAIWLAEQGWQVTAVDFSQVAVERGRGLARDRGATVEWLVADVTGYVPPTAHFDLVLISYLHLPAGEMADVLRRARKALRRDGVLVVVGHDLANLTGGIGGPQDPAVLHTPDAILAAIGDLRVRRAETARRPVSVDDGTVDALDTVVVAVAPVGALPERT